MKLGSMRVLFSRLDEEPVDGYEATARQFIRAVGLRFSQLKVPSPARCTLRILPHLFRAFEARIREIRIRRPCRGRALVDKT